MENGFKLGNIDIFFIKAKGEDMFLVQTYVDDIILVLLISFCQEFLNCMHNEFKICIM